MIKKQTFENTIKQVMIHNDYKSNWTTVNECDSVGKWTPYDLVIRDVLNNGGGSAKGFLGINKKRCLNAYEYICTHKVELIDKNRVNEVGINNWGILLWNHYNFDR